MAHKILVVDDEEIIRESLSFVLKKEGYLVEEAENGKAAYDKIVASSFDVVITDLEMPGMKGIQLVEEIQKLNIQTSIIIITAYGSLDTAISALRNGASDYILKPIEFDEILIKINRLFEIKDILLENRILKKEIQRTYDYENIVGKSPLIKNIYDMIETVAETESTVLVTGKSGTGKELVARALHFKSKRKNKAFIPVNCGAISENLIESELFGHERGAFSGAVQRRKGRFEVANGGTIFLDEIGDISFDVQVRLLRVLQERSFERVGGHENIKINIRVIAATGQNLEKAISEGRFREDLFYRLNVFPIHLPPLKERRSDIMLLADHFLQKYNERYNKNIRRISTAAINMMMSYHWPGNVRELK
ncbi:MAG TPA: Fis family transcriptional regulator, partial [Ignavibacteriales bacterium]|nr:Fis family transcriptional regulator [Ignavibacteriales bacterium]